MQISERDRILSGLCKAMEEVGEFQKGHWRAQGPGWGNEKSSKELVSFVDVESERRLAEVLLDLVPGSGFYGEETRKERKDLTWVVDPIDGTTNYLSGLDWFCVSVALYEGEKPLLSAILRPVAGEWFWAARGAGAYHRLGERPRDFPGPASPLALPRAQACPLQAALVDTGTPYRSPDTREAFYKAMDEVLTASRDIRRLGSAALDLALVAGGWIQAFWEVDLQPYDVGAALLLLEETGCEVSTIDGKPYSPFSSRSLVTGLPGAMAELRAIVARHYAGLRV